MISRRDQGSAEGGGRGKKRRLLLPSTRAEPDGAPRDRRLSLPRHSSPRSFFQISIEILRNSPFQDSPPRARGIPKMGGGVGGASVGNGVSGDSENASYPSGVNQSSAKSSSEPPVAWSRTLRRPDLPLNHSIARSFSKKKERGVRMPTRCGLFQISHPPAAGCRRGPEPDCRSPPNGLPARPPPALPQHRRTAHFARPRRNLKCLDSSDSYGQSGEGSARSLGRAFRGTVSPRAAGNTREFVMTP